MSFGQSDNAKLEWTERMWGYVCEGAASFEEGYLAGKKTGNRLEYLVTAQIDDLDALMARPDEGPTARHVPMTGWASCQMLFGENLPIQKGATFGLYWKDPQSGERRMSYDFQVIGQNNTLYTFSGYKRIVHDPGTFDILEDHTTLYATLQWMEGSQSKTAQGIIYFHLLTDLAPMLLSMLLPKSENLFSVISAVAHWKNRLTTMIRFFLFVSREVSEEYLKNIIPGTYETEYRNWVCKGTCQTGGLEQEFFLFSGIHPKGFPWGGDEGFSDIGLTIRDAEGSVRRFAFSDRSIANLELDFKDQAQGTYRYEGSLFEITNGYQVSFTDMRKDDVPGYLRKTPACLELTFTPQFVERKNVPFEASLERLKEFLEGVCGTKEKAGFLRAFDWISALLKAVEQWIKELKPLGYTADIYRLSNITGSLDLDGAVHEVVAHETLAEGEYGRLASFTIPTLYHNYFCAVEPASSTSTDDAFRVQIRSGTLRSIAGGSLALWVDGLLGKIIGGLAYMDFQVKSKPDGTLQHDMIEPREKADSLILPMANILEINNNHYPGHKIFQRRIVALPGTQQKEALALEEDMSILDLAPLGTEKTARVAAIMNIDRFAALDQVLDATGFFDVMENAMSANDGWEIPTTCY